MRLARALLYRAPMVIPASGSSAHAASFVARAAATAFAFVVFASAGGCIAEDEKEPTGKFSASLTRSTTAGCTAAESAHPVATVDVESAGSGKLTFTFRAGSETCVLAGEVSDDGVATVTSTKSCAIFPASVEGASAGAYHWTVPTPNITLYHGLPGNGTGGEPCAASDTWQLTRL